MLPEHSCSNGCCSMFDASCFYGVSRSELVKGLGPPRSSISSLPQRVTLVSDSRPEMIGPYPTLSQSGECMSPSMESHHAVIRTARMMLRRPSRSWRARARPCSRHCGHSLSTLLILLAVTMSPAVSRSGNQRTSQSSIIIRSRWIPLTWEASASIRRSLRGRLCTSGRRSLRSAGAKPQRLPRERGHPV